MLYISCASAFELFDKIEFLSSFYNMSNVTTDHFGVRGSTPTAGLTLTMATDKWGESNQAFDFGGDGAIDIGDIMLGNTGYAYEISFWFKADSAQPINYDTALGCGLNVGDGPILFRHSTGSNLWQSLLNYDTLDWNGFASTDWEQFNIVSNGTYAWIYRNDTRVDEGSYGGSQGDVCNDFNTYIGGEPQRTFWFNGIIDHLLIYNETVTTGTDADAWASAFYYDGNKSSPLESVAAPPPVIPFINLFNFNSTDNQTFWRGSPVNVTFSFHQFNSTNCSLYTNLTGGFSVDDSISSGNLSEETCVNETSTINITTINFNDSDNYAYYKLDESSGTNATDSSGNNRHGTLTNMGGTEWGAGILNNGLTFDGGNDFVNLGNIANFERTEEFSFDFWFKTSNSSAIFMLSRQLNTGTFRGWNIFIEGGKIKTALINDNGAINRLFVETDGTYNDNIWRHAAITYDGLSSASGLLIYVDGSLVAQSTLTDALSGSITNGANAQISGRDGANVVFNGEIDEVGIYNFTLNLGNITILYELNRTNITSVENTTEVCNETMTNLTLNKSTNYTLSSSMPEESKGTVQMFVNCFGSESVNSSIFTVNFDNDFNPPAMYFQTINTTYNDTYNEEIWINFTTSENASCVQDSVNWTFHFTNGTLHSYKETGTNSNGNFTVLVNCSDDSENFNSTILYIGRDLLSPTIEFFVPNINNQTVFLNNQFININFTFEDDIALFNAQINFSINSTGEVLFQENVSLSGQTYNYLRTSNVSSFLNTTYRAAVTVCDSHTKNKIPDADSIITSKSNGDFRIKLKGVNIKIKSEYGNVQSISHEKQKDRYSFGFIYDEDFNTKIYRLTSNKEIKYLEDSPFKGHFVIDNYYWVDFEQVGDVIVEEDGDKTGEYIIFVANRDREINFNSIGILNCQHGEVTFEITDTLSGTYNRIWVEGTNWFNMDVFNPETLSGAIFFIFFFMVIVFLIVLTEVTKIPFFGMLASLLSLAYSFLLFAVVSVVFAIVIIFLAAIYMFRAIMIMKE